MSQFFIHSTLYAHKITHFWRTMYINPESQLTHGKDKGRQVTFLLKDMFCAKVTTEEFCKDNLQCALLISEAGGVKRTPKVFCIQ